jgi:hypothetical protein
MTTRINNITYVNSCKGNFIFGNNTITFNNILHNFMYAHDSYGHVYDNYMNWFMENIVLYDKEPSTNIVRGAIDLYSIIYANELKKTTKQEKYDYMLLKLIQEKNRETEEAKKKSVLYSDFQKAKKSIAEKYSVMEYELKEKYFGVKRICKITKDTFKGNTSKILYRNYFANMKQTEIDDVFCYVDDNYVIVPKHKNNYAIKELTKVQTIKDESLRTTMLKELLFDIQFQYYSENLTIYDLFRADSPKIIAELENIRNGIKHFYLVKFGYTVLSNYFLYITLNNSHTKSDDEEYSNQLVFDFVLMDRTGYKYISFIDTIEKKTIDDIINNIQDNNMYFYGKNVLYNKQIDCIPIQKNIYPIITVKRDIVKAEANKFEIIFGTQNNRINIITVSNNPNKYHSYCSVFMLVEIGGKYFELSIKSVSYDIINSYIMRPNLIHKQFYDRLCTKLTDVLLTKPIHSFLGKKEFGEYIPAFVEIFSNEVDANKYTVPIIINYIETEQFYRTVMIPKIKSEITINTSVIMTMLWFRSFKNIYKKYYDTEKHKIRDIQLKYLLDNEDIKVNQEYSDEERAFAEFTYYILRNPFYGYFILGYIEHTEHFIKVLKYMDKIYYILYLIFNIDDYTLLQNEIDKIIYDNNFIRFRVIVSVNPTRKSILYRFIQYLNNNINKYVVWFCPEQLKISHYGKAIDFLKHKVPTKYAEIDKIRRLEGNRDIFNEFTNFYDIFKEQTFMHTIREWYDCKFRHEINDLINDTMFRTGVHNLARDPFYVFHFQYTPIQSDFQTNETQLDALKRYTNVKSERLKFYVDIKDATRITDMTVSMAIPITINKFLEIRNDKVKFIEHLCSIIKKEEYPLKYYSYEYIIQILQENIQ